MHKEMERNKTRTFGDKKLSNTEILMIRSIQMQEAVINMDYWHTM